VVTSKRARSVPTPWLAAPQEILGIFQQALIVLGNLRENVKEPNDRIEIEDIIFRGWDSYSQKGY